MFETRRLRTAGPPMFLAVPAALLTLAFVIAPLVAAAVMSVLHFDLTTGTFTPVGARNFISELSSDGFRRSLVVTLCYAVLTVIPSLSIGLGVALLIRNAKRGARFWQAAYYVPFAATVVATATLWRLMLTPGVGVLDFLIRAAGGQGHWLARPGTAVVALAVVGTWHQVGLVVVVYVASFSGIAAESYDAAEMDGAGRWHSFRAVTWPALKAPTAFLAALLTSFAFREYDTIAALTAGGPAGATETLTFRMWHRGVNFFDIGRASVIAVALLLAALLIAATPYVRRHLSLGRPR